MSRKRTGNRKSKGLGDTVAKITEATGIAEAVKTVFPDCGCEKRKEWLNKTFPYVNAKKACMNEEQQEFYKAFKEKHLSKKTQAVIPNEELKKLIDLYNSVFQVDVRGCGDCNASIYLERLDKVYLAHEEDSKTT